MRNEIKLAQQLINFAKELEEKNRVSPLWDKTKEIMKKAEELGNLIMDNQ